MGQKVLWGLLVFFIGLTLVLALVLAYRTDQREDIIRSQAQTIAALQTELKSKDLDFKNLKHNFNQSKKRAVEASAAIKSALLVLREDENAPLSTDKRKELFDDLHEMLLQLRSLLGNREETML